MSKTVKCDKCGVVVEYVKGASCTNMEFKVGWCLYDVCDNCRLILETLVRGNVEDETG